MWSKLIVIASMVSAASAACPNQCSGHGTCSGKEVCTCYDNWGMGGVAGGDCSDRICPYELAWVDTPTLTGGHHQYAECAAKGICDRETGQCECLAGYTGKACARQVCPDDCSGHGSCTLMSDLTYGAVYNDFHSDKIGSGSIRPTDIDLPWDSTRARACVCDAGWDGINCASRSCPHGNDSMDSRLDGSTSEKKQIQRIRLLLGGADREADWAEAGAASGAGTFAAMITAQLESQSFALTFTSKLNERFTTKPLYIQSGWETSNAFGDKVESALKELPNWVIDDVEVSAGTIADGEIGVGMEMLITFKGTRNHGNQNLLEVEASKCDDGCFPKITGLSYLVSPLTSTNTTSSVVEMQSADFNSYECGRRGKCDYDVGICTCFEGFSGEACSDITALV